MHASEIIRPVAQHSSWLLNLGPHDYLKPAWGLVRTRDIRKVGYRPTKLPV